MRYRRTEEYVIKIDKKNKEHGRVLACFMCLRIEGSVGLL
jgi:hypothetical protein